MPVLGPGLHCYSQPQGSSDLTSDRSSQPGPSLTKLHLPFTSDQVPYHAQALNYICPGFQSFKLGLPSGPSDPGSHERLWEGLRPCYGLRASSGVRDSTCSGERSSDPIWMAGLQKIPAPTFGGKECSSDTPRRAEDSSFLPHSYIRLVPISRT